MFPYWTDKIRGRIYGFVLLIAQTLCYWQKLGKPDSKSQEERTINNSHYFHDPPSWTQHSDLDAVVASPCALVKKACPFVSWSMVCRLESQSLHILQTMAEVSPHAQGQNESNEQNILTGVYIWNWDCKKIVPVENASNFSPSLSLRSSKKIPPSPLLSPRCCIPQHESFHSVNISLM